MEQRGPRDGRIPLADDRQSRRRTLAAVRQPRRWRRAAVVDRSDGA